ncbi:MAG: hypothetical protein ACI90G_002487, partial [Urechidicola sp.]
MGVGTTPVDFSDFYVAVDKNLVDAVIVS